MEKLTNQKFIERSVKIHGNLYDYSVTNYLSINNDVKIICKEHGIFLQNAGNHMSGNGCPVCGFHKTKAQNDWLNMLNIKNREVYFKIGDNQIKADGYDKETNTIYEFWGDYWHGNPLIFKENDINPSTGTSFGYLYQKTINKRRLILENGFKLIEIWENNWRKISNGNC